MHVTTHLTARRRALPLRLASALTLALPLAPAAAQPADTTKVSTDPLFTERDAMIAGVFAISTMAMWSLDRSLARTVRDDDLQNQRFLRETSNVVRDIGHPGSTIIGVTMYAAGRLTGSKRWADLGLHGTEALYAGAAVAGVIKVLAGRARPYVDTTDIEPRDFQFLRGRGTGDYKSFPSGHTTAAFAAASAVTSETSRWWPKATPYIATLMYGGALSVGVSRMYENKHWASDVAMGAAIGTFSGLKVVRYHHSHPNNRIDRWLLSSTTVTGDGRGNFALAVTRPFPGGPPPAAAADSVSRGAR